MANEYFITPSEIKATGYIDENVDEKYINVAILISQDLYILPMIGTGLFNELKTQTLAQSWSTHNTTLLTTYIQPALKHWVLYEVVEPLTYKFTNKSIVKKKSENSEVADKDELVRLKDKFRNIAEFYTERMRKYLVANSATFTLYDNPGSAADTVFPKRDSFSIGWYLGGSSTGSRIDKLQYPGTYSVDEYGN